jgi:hypothetical protein
MLSRTMGTGSATAATGASKAQVRKAQNTRLEGFCVAFSVEPQSSLALNPFDLKYLSAPGWRGPPAPRYACNGNPETDNQNQP